MLCSETPEVFRIKRLNPKHHYERSSLPHLEFALSKQRAEVSDALRRDGVTLWLVLGHLILQGDEADCGALLLLQAKELQNPLVVIHITVDENEEDLDKKRWKVSIQDYVSRLIKVRLRIGHKNICIDDVILHTRPLNPCAAFLNWSILSWKSAEALGRNMRMWDLISPPKILGAVCRKQKV